MIDAASSVYFFYDPKYKPLNLGIVGSIIEIEWMQKLQKTTYPLFKWYYFGYYIQSCDKMVYKGDFGPNELLCPYTYRFVPFTDEIRKQIDKGIVRLSPESDTILEDLEFPEKEEEMDILIQGNSQVLLNNEKMGIFDLNKSGIQLLTQIIRNVANGLGKSILKETLWKVN